MSGIPSISIFNAVAICTVLWTFVKLIRISRRRLRTTKLRGPPSPSFVYGVGKMILEADDPASMYESWAQEYGAVYEVPSTLGESKVILYDPKAIAHLLSNDTRTYVRIPLIKKGLEHAFGRGLFSVDGESHRRQRKILTPAFSVTAIRNLTPIYYDSAHKAKSAWNALIESSGQNSAIIDVQNWMNHTSFDTMGIAGFSHDFGALDGKRASVTKIFDAFSSTSPASALYITLNLLAQAFPFLANLPTSRTKLIVELSHAMEEILNILMDRTKKELCMDFCGNQDQISIIGLLIKESTSSEFHMSREDMLAQMKVLLLAGYETTAITMTWALIELSRNSEVQTKLRNELVEYGSDPTYDQLSNGLPYLDAVVHEVLRMHAPIADTLRMASEDDVVPLSEPVRTKSGKLVENLSLVKGTIIGIPMASLNLSTAFWGEDAKTFKPSRWLANAIPEKVREIQGHRHLLTFSDGPRTCLGKLFAITEFKAVLSVLVKSFVFELRDGPETKIEMGRGILPRPRMTGEVGCVVPLRVRPYME